MVAEINMYDIVMVDFGSDPIDSEQGGIRPAIVIQNNIGNKYSPNTIVMPTSTQLKKVDQPTHTLIKCGVGNIKKTSVVLGEQIRSISKQRIFKKIGNISDNEVRENIKNCYLANMR